jgi:hypothetical protein
VKNRRAQKQLDATRPETRTRALRGLYAGLLRLHPKPFRQQFADEMLWIFDQQAAEERGAGRLFLDALASLARQWLLRPEYRQRPLVVASSRAGGPTFHSLESSRPRTSLLIQGGLLSLAAFSLVTYAIGKGGGSPPSLLFGVHFPREGLLPVKRSSIEPQELTTEVKMRLPPEDAWRQLAKAYFGTILLLGTLDADDDLILSPAEISNAPAALRKLDLDGDGALSPQEAGQRFGDPEMVRRLDPEFVRQAGLGFMRLHPVLAALDADRGGAISAAEIGNSPAALRKLDRDGDGSLIAPEVLPDSVANETAVYLSRLDTNRDGRISRQERSNVPDEQVRELLDHADRDRDGVVVEEELASELRLRDVRKRALDNAVRSAFGSDLPGNRAPASSGHESQTNPRP